MDRPGERRIPQAYLEGNTQYQPANRTVVRTVIHNGNDFNDAYLKIHQAMGDPKFENELRPKSPQIQRWSQEVQHQLDENRHQLGTKMSTIRTVIGSDPKLTPLSQRVDNILGDYNRNVYKDLPNEQYIDHNKKRNQDCLVVADQQFTKDNRHPPLSSTHDLPRTSTVKIYTNENNAMTRFDVDKEFQGDKVNVVQVRQAEQPIGSSMKKRPTRTPVKQHVNVDQNNLISNAEYDPNNMVKSYIHHDEAKEASGRKIIFANDTDPESAAKRRPQPVERLIVVQNVDNNTVTPQKQPRQPEPEMERFIITSNDYKDPNQGYPQQRPQPFQQYPVVEKLAIEPAFNQRQQLWEFSPYRPYQNPWSQFGNYQQQQVFDRRAQEPAFETREWSGYRAASQKMLPRASKLTEVREISIQYPAQYFAHQPTVKQIDIENCSLC